MDSEWKSSYERLTKALGKMGYPDAFADLIARNLRSPKLMDRMCAYLREAKPRSAEEIADEMLAICDDRDRWIRKKESENANARYNEMLYYGIAGTDEGAEDE